MLKFPELAMPRTRKVTTVCNGRREVWTPRARSVSEQSAFTFSFFTGLTSAATRTNKQRKGFAEMQSLCYTRWRTEILLTAVCDD